MYVDGLEGNAIVCMCLFDFVFGAGTGAIGWAAFQSYPSVLGPLRFAGSFGSRIANPLVLYRGPFRVAAARAVGSRVNWSA